MRNKKFLFKFSVSILLIILGLVFAMHESIHYRDISFLPLSLGVTVLLISLFRKLAKNSGMGPESQGSEKDERKEVR